MNFNNSNIQSQRESSIMDKLQHMETPEEQAVCRICLGTEQEAAEEEQIESENNNNDIDSEEDKKKRR